jgi:hypothetical protein
MGKPRVDRRMNSPADLPNRCVCCEDRYAERLSCSDGARRLAACLREQGVQAVRQLGGKVVQ